MKLIKGILVGTVLLSAGQALADDSTTAEIRLLKEKLRQLEQRVDTQSKNDYATRAKLAAIEPGPVYKGPSAFDPCPEGKVCYKGITLTFGGWIDLAGIYRSRNIASDTGSLYSAIPFPQARNFGTSESRFSARQTRFSVLAEGDRPIVTTSWIRLL